jgi:hypothetical protein
MITEDICKALYALPGGVVTPRRRTIVIPAVAAAVGVVLLIINFLAIDDSDSITAMTLISIGVLLLLYGVITAILRLVSKQTSPYDVEAGCFMHCEEHYYDAKHLAVILKAMEHDDMEAIERLSETNISSLILIIYSSPAKMRTAYALYEYRDFGYRLVQEPTIFTS